MRRALLILFPLLLTWSPAVARAAEVPVVSVYAWTYSDDVASVVGVYGAAVGVFAQPDQGECFALDPKLFTTRGIEVVRPNIFGVTREKPSGPRGELWVHPPGTIPRLEPLTVVVSCEGPHLVAIVGMRGELDGGIARRRGVVTTGDLEATILDAFGLPVPRSIGGNVLQGVVSDDPLDEARALGARFERDAHYGPGLTIVTVVFALGALLLALLFAALRRNGISILFLRVSAMTPAGYVAALFIPHQHWAVRSLAVLAACVIGAGSVLVTDWRHIRPGVVTGTSKTRAFCGWVIVGTATAVALLAIAAALRPNGEPALSLWGDPLVSWRFFGLRNHLAAFIAGGAIVGAMLLGFPWRLAAVGMAAALVVTGAPKLGANFIGVTTMALGAAVALLVVWRKRFEWWQIFASGAFALGVTFLAFLSDAGSPVSHGGRAAQTIRSGGLDAAWDIFSRRARINYREVMDVPIPLAGPIAFVGLVIVLAGFLVWASRAPSAPPSIRSAVAGGAAAALAALFVEDSGFLTGGILALYPGLAFVLWLLDAGGGTTIRSPRGAPRPLRSRQE